MDRITRRLHADQRGASLVEYALLVALIAVVCIVAVTFVGTSGKAKFNGAGSAIKGSQDGLICYDDGDGGHFLYDPSNGSSGPTLPGPCP